MIIFRSEPERLLLYDTKQRKSAILGKSLHSNVLETINREHIKHKYIDLTRVQAIPPEMASFEVTSRCNLRCKHCYYAERLCGADISTDSAKDILKQLGEYGVLSVAFTGGEPTLHKDIEELICYAAEEAQMGTCLMTNGTIRNRRLEALYSHVPKDRFFVQVSLDSMDSAINDNFRGKDGAASKTREFIDYTREQQIPFMIATTISRQNQDLFEQLIAYASEAGAFSVYALPVFLAGAAKPELQPHREKLMHTLQSIPALEQKYNMRIVLPLSCLGIGNGGCEARKGARFTVGVDGKAYLCETARYALGDLTKEDVQTMWTRYRHSDLHQGGQEQFLKICRENGGFTDEVLR